MKYNYAMNTGKILSQANDKAFLLVITTSTLQPGKEKNEVVGI